MLSLFLFAAPGGVSQVYLDGSLLLDRVCLALAGDTVLAVSTEPCDWFLVTPVPGAYDDTAEDLVAPYLYPCADNLAYSSAPLAVDACCFGFVAGEEPCLPDTGTFYLAAVPHGLEMPDSIYCRDPLHMAFPWIVQVAVRPGNTYLDYLFETLGTPFVMAPCRTPGGFHQADDRMGFDCAGLAIYGARRAGMDVAYLGPGGIIDYLEPVAPGLYFPEPEDGLSVYRNESGETLPIGEQSLIPGDILHFRCQVSVFLEDRGIKGVLDSEDLVIQSWFDGTMICTIAENSFLGLPLRAMRWTDRVRLLLR